MLTQDEIRRAMYEDREKARRDAASWQSALDRWKEEAEQLRQEVAITGERRELIGRIRTYEQILEQEARPEEELAAMSIDELNAVLASLRDEYQRNGHS